MAVAPVATWDGVKAKLRELIAGRLGINQRAIVFDAEAVPTGALLIFVSMLSVHDVGNPIERFEGNPEQSVFYAVQEYATQIRVEHNTDATAVPREAEKLRLFFARRSTVENLREAGIHVAWHPGPLLELSYSSRDDGDVWTVPSKGFEIGLRSLFKDAPDDGYTVNEITRLSGTGTTGTGAPTVPYDVDSAP